MSMPETKTPLLEVRDLVKHFPIRKSLFGKAMARVHAVDGISLDIAPGETLGLVGESGCGKSTAGKVILRLIEPTSGSIRLEGRDITGLSRDAVRWRLARGLEALRAGLLPQAGGEA